MNRNHQLGLAIDTMRAQRQKFLHMSTSLMSFGGVLFALPILICQWVGILGLGKTTRNAAWWCMMSGVCGTTLGSISYGVYMGMLMAGFSSMPSLGSMLYLLIPTSLSGLGSLLFSIGFAIHGQKVSKSDERITELESIATAQGEEINRLRAS
jgi:hypothetical protein